MSNKKTYLNVFPNSLTPFSQGGLQSILLGVVVEELIRYAVGLPTSIVDDIEVHAYMLSMQGSLHFGDPSAKLRNKEDKTNLKQDIMDAVKTIPAMLLAIQAHTFRKTGIEVSDFTSKENMVRIVAQLLQRPLLQQLFSMLPNDPQAAFLALEVLLQRQASNARRAPEAV